MAARAAGYRRGWLAVKDFPAPCVAVGNLTLGGSGKSALAAWIAQHYAARGIQPGLLVPAGTSADVLVHRHAVPTAIVLGDRDAVAAGERAVAQGAQVLVLDDAYQRLDLHRDLNLAVVAAETTRAVRWTLPAGPWREGWAALGEPTASSSPASGRRSRPPRRWPGRSSARSAGPVAVAYLGLRHLEGLVSGTRQPAGVLAGKRVVAASGIADPDAFVAQTKATGAAVQVATWKDQAELPRRGRRLAGARGPAGGSRRDHREGRSQAARPMAQPGAGAARGGPGARLGGRRGRDRRGARRGRHPRGPTLTEANRSRPENP